MIHSLGSGSPGTAKLSTASDQPDSNLVEDVPPLPLRQQNFGQLLERSTEQGSVSRTQSVAMTNLDAKSKASDRHDVPVGSGTANVNPPVVATDETVTTPDEDVMIHTWLTLLEEIQHHTSADDSLAQLADQQGLTEADLKAALHDALTRLDASMRQLDGKDLPATLDAGTPAATLGQLFQAKDKLDLDPKLQGLMYSIGQLPDAQQEYIQSQLAQVLELEMQYTAPDIDETQALALQELRANYRQLQQHYSAEERAAAFEHLSAVDIALVQALADDGHALALERTQPKGPVTEHDTEAETEFDVATLQALLASLAGHGDSAQAAGNGKPKQNETRQNQQHQKSVAGIDEHALAQHERDIQNTQAELVRALQQLHTALTAQQQAGSPQALNRDTVAGEINRTNAQLPTAIAELTALLKAATSATSDVAAGQLSLVAAEPTQWQAIHQLTQALSTLANAATQNPEASETLDTEQMALILADLRQLLERKEIEQGAASRNLNVPNQQLPPAAQALSDLARQVREQLAAMQGQRPETGDPARENFSELLHRVETTAAQVNAGARTNEFASSVNNSTITTIVQATPSAREAGTAQVPAQSAFENARQTQQAIDILGTQVPERLRERVAVMFNTRTQAAEMRLDPPDLGRLTIRLNMNQDQASVSFQVTTPQARDALEHNVPRLRELLAEQGIQLADANVSEQSGQRHQPSGEDDNANQQAGLAYAIEEIANDSELIEVQVSTNQETGRVDYFV